MSSENFQIIHATPVATSSIDQPKTRGGRTKRVYRCSHCARTFKRSEHCARHELVHTQERPFPCSFCNRRYARKDLVKRHERSLHEAEYKAKHPDEFRTSSLQIIEHGEPSPARTLLKRIDANCSGSDRQIDSRLAPLAAQPPFGQYSPPASLDELQNTLGRPPGHDSEHLRTLSSSLDFNIGTVGCEPSFDQSHNHHPTLLFLDGFQEQEPTPLGPPLHLSLSPHPVGFPFDAADHLAQEEGIIPNNQLFSPRAYTPQLSFGDVLSKSALVGFETMFPDVLLEHEYEYEQNTSDELPRIHSEQSPCLPEFTITEKIHWKICEDARSRWPIEDSADALLPTVTELGRFFSGYVECFHPHFPILHLRSMDLTETPSPLIFAICSIGAQYRLDRRRAKNLFALAGTMSAHPAPLWIMQTRVLLSLSGIFSGKTSVVLRTVENLGLFAIDYRLRISQLRSEEDSQFGWEEWISRESSKRLLCGMFIVSNLISTTFGLNPGFNYTDDLEFEVLDQEKLWGAKSAQEWLELRGTSNGRLNCSVQQIMTAVVLDEPLQAQCGPKSISGLTMLLLMHAVNLYNLNILQLGKMSGQNVRHALLDSAFSALSRCHRIIAGARGRDELGYTEVEGPILFNCVALLRIAYFRLFSDTSAFSRLTLLSDNLEDITMAVTSYAKSHQQRSPDLTKSVLKAYEGFSVYVKLGPLLLRKTAALGWSVEQAVGAWDAALLLTKWIHTIETEALVQPPDAAENCILEGLNNLLKEFESEYNGSGSLAAATAQVMATMFTDVWVWGVTPRMGNILQQLVHAYEADYRSLTPRREYLD
ncbi:hypothetical protein CC78DRAFT_456731 [Lojkania enalia]|uniref:C2H2-type domain-containing protein n=1 Tax=Lojkania enalia TaxID=147567 RepID=A0A9P4KH79_9PLEO|nr:hypothetical protein CC78DRAFT_456731 [Didymosphaeria enalia]